MELLYCFKEYIEQFHQISFRDFSVIYNSLYDNYQDLQNKVEFSLVVDKINPFDLRFGLFKINNPKKILSFLKKSGYEQSNLERILKVATNFTPEFAVGFDFNTKSPKAKTYFLRLPDNEEFRKNPDEKIIRLVELIDIDLKNINTVELDGCYLIAIDFYKTNKESIKIYSREEKVDFNRIKDCLKKNEISLQHLESFQELFSKAGLKDITISKKYSANEQGNQKNMLSGLSVFFELNYNLNLTVERLVEMCVPEKFIELKRTIEKLGNEHQIKYSHIGISFSREKEPNESVSLYFSTLASGG
jgi:hypothetical protein